MKITRIKIKRVPEQAGLVGFASLVVDNWLYLANIALYTRMTDKTRLRLVFPEKRIKLTHTTADSKISLYYPLDKETYFELEGAITKKFFEDI